MSTTIPTIGTTFTSEMQDIKTEQTAADNRTTEEPITTASTEGSDNALAHGGVARVGGVVGVVTVILMTVIICVGV